MCLCRLHINTRQRIPELRIEADIEVPKNDAVPQTATGGWLQK